ncbi:MAG: hypothetical protein CL698_06620 [Chloroflexi bacterium]|nr:hypothetical protein [Chloroflexota bacterium]MQG01544.1 hypothetical protein [SAR202 cluster bacterium]|tara:strand:- start:624 stop:1535 length:912 start_codon:yes stop_codon:yes gene_type:complete
MNKFSGYVDLGTHKGRLSLIGSDALDLLDRLTTNRISDLTSTGMGMGAVLTTNKGRIIDLLGIHVEEKGLMVVTSGNATEKVSDWIDFYTIMEDVQIKNVSDQTFHFRVIGTSPEIEVLPDTTGMKPFHGVQTELAGVPSLAISLQVGNLSCIDLIGSVVRGDSVQSKLDEYLKEIRIEEYNHLRIDAGEPAYGSELTEEFNPLEAGLLPYISFNKGCYIGQEVVARLNTYDKVQRKLVKFKWDSVDYELSGKAIEDEDRVVGVMTSSLHGLGMGFVRKAKAEEGNVMICDGVKITVADILAD